MATKKKNTTSIPAGFTEIDNSLGGFWKPTVSGQTLQGVVCNMIETKGADDKPNRFYAIRISNPCSAVFDGDGKAVSVSAGDLVGVGGAVLLSFLSGREGQEIFCVFRGLGDKKPGKNAPKLFTTYARDFDEETGEVVR